MIFPQQCIVKRPGLFFPVFFLSLFTMQVSGQLLWQESAVAALGSAYVTRPGYFTAGHNQAGLGWIENHSLSIQHSRPFIVKEFGISSLSAQMKINNGAFGATLSTYGLEGLRQTSSWLSLGIRLHPGITAGLGIHLWTWSIPEQILHHPGISFALGIQARISEHLMMGAHILHPLAWTAAETLRQKWMTISVGLSYTFFGMATWYSEFHVLSEERVQLCNGLEWKIGDGISLFMGIHNGPFVYAAGIHVENARWSVQFAFQYVTDSGSIPQTSIHYDW
jgi:hypothetical protein